MGNPWEIDALHMAIRLFLAMVLGGLVGWEREQSNRAAGFRTHILVCIGSALLMLLSIYGFSDFAEEINVRIDPARMAAQVITGIGFLGAGVIIYNGLSITGLTTAASLWVVAAIGLSIGAGFYFAASLCTALVLFNLMVLNKVEKRLFRAKKLHVIKIKTEDKPGNLGEITEVLKMHNTEIRRLTTEHIPNEGSSAPIFQIAFTVRLPAELPLVELIEKLRKMPGVLELNVDQVAWTGKNGERMRSE
ncbi:MAG TPA: MgtC/SapB family protein [Bacilli bacterium]